MKVYPKSSPKEQMHNIDVYDLTMMPNQFILKNVFIAIVRELEAQR